MHYKNNNLFSYSASIRNSDPAWRGVEYFLPREALLGQQRSAFAIVHFCISQYTALLLDRIVQGSSCRAPDNNPAAVLFDLSCFLNLGCQGSAVGGCLLYFFKKKELIFFSSRETAHWGRRSRTTPSLPRHRDLRAFVSCMA